MEKIKVSAAFILMDGRVLIAQRGDSSYEGKWEFPGGKVKPNESGETAVVRELEEELGIKVKPQRLLATVTGVFDDRNLDIDLYQCKIVSGDVTLKEHLDAKWVSKSEFSDYDFLVPDRLFIDVIKAINPY